jgi:hypothetical protein
METILIDSTQLESLLQVLEHIRTAILWIFGLLLFKMFSDYFEPHKHN